MIKKSINSNFANINLEDKTIILSENEITDNFCKILKNVTISFDKNNIATIKGDKILWGFSFERQFVSNMKDKPDDRYISLQSRNILKWFTGDKEDCVKAGWYKLKDTKQETITMHTWSIVK